LNELVQHGGQTLTPEDARALVTRVADSRARVLAELRKVVIGQEESVDLVLAALFAGGHCLLTGVPGLAKTLLVRTLAQILDLGFRRIQFTPDLMPSDITGTEVLDETDGIRALRFVRGPVFTQMLLADEINRTPPKTQAALLEAMQEGHVTAAGRSYQLDPPFFVLATQNPIELEGTYPLPEAQLDRFLFNVVMTYLPEHDEVKVVTETTSVRGAPPNRVLSREEIVAIQGLVRHVVIAEEVARYAVRLSAASRPGQPGVPDFVNRYIKWGAGLRASQALVLGGKARALMMGRAHVTVDDIRVLAAPVFRHRVLTNFQAESEGLTPDAIVAQLIEVVPAPASGLA
jgi:MoxR-like ATPase